MATKKRTVRGYHVDEKDINDEVDDFMAQRDKVSLTQDKASDDEDDLEAVSDEEELAKPSDESDNEEAKEQPEGGWGKKKYEYYDADTKDFEIESDEEVALAEERESKRLQEERTKELATGDFELPLETLIETGDDQKVTNKKKKQTKDLIGDLEAIQLQLGVSDDSAEKVPKELTNLSTNEKLQIIANDSPELLGLLEEFKVSLKDLTEEVSPLLSQVKEGKMPTEHGISFLEVKQQLLLMYCSHLAFYLLLKAEGKQVKDHPVIKQLVHIRTMLEKIKPINAKLKYQIDKLLKKNTGAVGGDIPTESLSFKPKPEDLLSKDDEGIELEDLPRVPSTKEIKDKTDAYRPPKITPTSLEQDEKKAIRRKERKEKSHTKAKRDAALDDLRRDIYNLPEIQDVGGGVTRVKSFDEKEKEAFEEDQFVRLPGTKADKKKQKQRIGAFDDFDDFGDVSKKLDKKKEAAGPKAKSKKGVKFQDENIASDDDDNHGGGMDEIDKEGEEAYEKFFNQSETKKKKRKGKQTKDEILYNEIDPDVKTGDRRGASKQILKNRGLVAHRRKDLKNPRKRQRHRYDEALKRRRSVVQEYKGKQMNYSGQETGIKKNLIKSHKLR